MDSEISWQKSSFSDQGGQCIEIAKREGVILMRESDDPNIFATVSSSKFSSFISGIKAGEFDHFIY
ncbi:DUF397 domain-containing protein [Streptomyces sp. NBC_01429]|uniref:DUF397 domain-containing protein n=1 Tax=Streptomyces sp. NBC_01429 TaxID=2903862 RepID=UPI002E29107E|nr:DUF397 domain-containing protein [Streptomyces sp. NBC_01429]